MFCPAVNFEIRSYIDGFVDKFINNENVHCELDTLSRCECGLCDEGASYEMQNKLDKKYYLMSIDDGVIEMYKNLVNKDTMYIFLGLAAREIGHNVFSQLIYKDCNYDLNAFVYFATYFDLCNANIMVIFMLDKVRLYSSFHVYEVFLEEYGSLNTYYELFFNMYDQWGDENSVKKNIAAEIARLAARYVE